jgi:hypothetical protein
MEIVSQNFKGVIPPVRIDHTNGDGRIQPIIDWGAIATKHTPANVLNPQYELTLEYLTLNYYLPTLLRVPSSSYPEYRAADKELQRALKTVEFKRSFSPDKNYAVQFLLWNSYMRDWRDVHFDRDQLQNVGMEGRINLIKPYLVTVGDTVFGDKLSKLGISIFPRFLQLGDYLEISGGYSGSISYLIVEPEINLISGSAGSQKISTTPTLIMWNQSKRASLFLCNAGSERVYWMFTQNSSSLVAGAAPFLEPGESLTVEDGELFFSGKNEHLILKNRIKSICKLSLYGICETGEGKVTYQELRYP